MEQINTLLGAVTVSTTVAGQGSGPILFYGVACTGNEYNLFECGNTGLRELSCSHSSDAAVACMAGKRFSMLRSDPLNEKSCDIQVVQKEMFNL